MFRTFPRINLWAYGPNSFGRWGVMADSEAERGKIMHNFMQHFTETVNWLKPSYNWQYHLKYDFESKGLGVDLGCGLSRV